MAYSQQYTQFKFSHAPSLLDSTTFKRSLCLRDEQGQSAAQLVRSYSSSVLVGRNVDGAVKRQAMSALTTVGQSSTSAWTRSAQTQRVQRNQPHIGAPPYHGSAGPDGNGASSMDSFTDLFAPRREETHSMHHSAQNELSPSTGESPNGSRLSERNIDRYRTSLPQISVLSARYVRRSGEPSYFPRRVFLLVADEVIVFSEVGADFSSRVFSDVYRTSPLRLGSKGRYGLCVGGR